MKQTQQAVYYTEPSSGMWKERYNVRLGKTRESSSHFLTPTLSESLCQQMSNNLDASSQESQIKNSLFKLVFHPPHKLHHKFILPFTS